MPPNAQGRTLTFGAMWGDAGGGDSADGKWSGLITGSGLFGNSTDSRKLQVGLKMQW